MKQLITSSRFALLAFRRNPAASFFTIVLPLIFMVLFGTIFGGETMSNGAKVATFTVPGILALSLVSATFVNLAITTVFQREKGQLKRIRITPLRPVVFIASQIFAATVIVAIMTVLLIVVGKVLFDVTFNLDTLPTFLITVILATAVFSALGLALTTIIPNENAAPAFTNMIALPLYFVSDVFIQTDNPPAWLKWVGDIFPVKHLARALQPSFNPFLQNVEIPWAHWAVMAAWGIFGAIVAATRFKWSAS